MRHAAILHVIGRAMLPAMLTTAVILTTGSPFTPVAAAHSSFPDVGLHADSAPVGYTSTHYVETGESIQDAVDAADAGDTVVVAAGTYSENVTIEKALTLRSEDGADVTIIDGGTATGAFAVKVTASSVTIDGFTVKTGDTAAASQYGIQLIEGTDCTISHNTVVTNWYGVLIGSNSHDNTVTDNTVVSNQFGVHLGGGAYSNTVFRNELSDNTYGIYVVSSSGNLLTNNTILSNLSGTRGVTFMSGSGSNTCSDNTITVTLFGVYNYGGTNYVDYNTIASDDTGIYAASSVTSYYRGNTITGCATGFYAYAIGHVVYSNNFVDNTVQAQISEEASGWILWYNEQADTGNYWSDYLTRYPGAEEVGETGVYDTPYVIREDSMTLNKDFYPLVSQYVPPVQTWTLSVDANGEGTVEVDAVEVTFPYSEVYEDGTEVTLTATAADGSRFTGWSGDVSSTQPEITITMEQDTSVTATFELESIDLTLNTGWNMVSVPVQADDMSVSALFGNDIDAICTWNPGEGAYDELTGERIIQPGVGYWVAVSEPITITVTGTPVTELIDYPLLQGWNMLGSVYGGAVDVTDLVDDPSGYVDDEAVYWWNPATGEFDPVTQFEQGKGYWVVASAACNVTMTAP